jgi:hypothetical protein
MSYPSSSRWVANEWRKLWHVARLARPTARTACFAALYRGLVQVALPTRTTLEVGPMERSRPLQLVAQQHPRRIRQDRHPVLRALAATDDELAAGEVHVLHPELETLVEAEPPPYRRRQTSRTSPSSASSSCRTSLRLRTTGILSGFRARTTSVNSSEGRRSTVRGRGDPILRRQPGQKHADLRRPQLGRVPHAHRPADLLQQPRLIGHLFYSMGLLRSGRAKKRETQRLPDAAALAAACGFSLSHASHASNRNGRPRKFSISVAAGAEPPGARTVSR